MSYLGNTPTQQGFIPAIDFFSGNGSTTAFTLSRPVASVAQVQATIENVPQNPGTAFTVSGNTITFDGAPASGTNNIYVYYTSPITQVIQPGQGTVGSAQFASGVTVPFGLGSAAAPSITFTGDSNTGIFSPGADTIAFAEGGAEVARFDSSGNLGVGTNSPASILHANSNAVSSDIISDNSNSGISSSNRFGFAIREGGVERSSFRYLRDGTGNSQLTANAGFLFNVNSVEQARITSAGLMQFNSGYGSVATAFGCRAWVNFNGTNNVIRASGNVSSITDLGVGQYRANFTIAMPDANYACVFGINSGNTTNPNCASFNGSFLQTTSVDFGTFEGSNSTQEYARVTLAILR